jgi:hypothetical protein
MGALETTARGVYLDVKLSPYVYKMGNGDILRFSSKKKLQIFRRELPKRKLLLSKLCDKINELTDSKECDCKHLTTLIEIQLYRGIEKI